MSSPLKFAKAARDYFALTPEDKIIDNLHDYIYSSSCSKSCDSSCDVKKHHIDAIGWEWLQCGTVACLAGVLWTMPEVHEHAQRHYKEEYENGDKRAALSTALREMLNYSEHQYKQGVSLFCSVQKAERYVGGTDKDIALHRLDGYIKLLEEDERINADVV